MGKKVKIFKSKKQISRSDLVAFLQKMADGIAEGKVTLREGDDEISLNCAENFTLEIEAEDKKKKGNDTRHSLEFELKWFDEEAPVEKPSTEGQVEDEEAIEAIPEQSELSEVVEE